MAEALNIFIPEQQRRESQDGCGQAVRQIVGAEETPFVISSLPAIQPQSFQ